MDALRALIESDLKRTSGQDTFRTSEVQDMLLDLLVLVLLSNAQLVAIS